MKISATNARERYFLLPMFTFFIWPGKVLLLFFLLPILFLNLRAQDLLLRPSEFNSYQTHQIVSDSLIRVFGISNASEGFQSGFSFYKNYNIGGSDQVPTYFHIGPLLNFTYSVVDLKVLPFVDGGFIVGFTLFDCDHDPPGGLIKYAKDGSIEWWVDIYELGFFGGVTHMVFADSGIVVTLGSFGNTYNSLLFSKEGDLINDDYTESFHDQTVETDFGFLASQGDRLELLDQNFSVFESFTLEEIQTISYLGHKQYLIATSAAYYLLSEDLILRTLDISRGIYSTIWTGAGNYYAFQASEQQVDVFDTLFSIVESYPVLKGYDVKVGLQNDEKIATAGTYSNNLNRWTYFQQTSTTEPTFDRSPDIGITNIEIADTIYVEYYNLPANGGWFRYYDYINVEVTNYSNDTISEFVIENDVLSNCFWCDYEYHTWEITDQPIPPFSTVHVALGQYTQPCTAFRPKDICLRTILPEYGVDANFENDKFCQPYSITIPTNEVPRDYHVEVFPNPTITSLNVRIEGLAENDFEITVYNMSGQLMEQFDTAESFEIPVTDYSPGIYLLHIAGESGRIVKRFNVQH